MNPQATSLQSWRAAGWMMGHACGDIFTRVEGTGSALLMIHGFPTASWDWSTVWPAMTPHYRCLTLDMIGFGFSAKPRRFDYSIGAQADLIEDFLAYQKAHEYAIVAHDYGDTVAQELLARHNHGNARQQLTGVVFLNGGLFPETHRPVLIQKLLASPIGPLVVRLTTFRKFAANMRKICARPLAESDLEGMWQLMTINDGLAILPKLIGYMAERRKHRQRWVGAIQQSKVPIRLINGLCDPISGAHMVARYRELMPNADIVELADVGHYPQVEAAKDVVEAVLDFFADR